VPDENVDVLISSTASNEAVINSAAADANLYDNIAKASDLTIQDNIWVEVNTNADILEIHGNLIIENNGLLDMSDGNTSTNSDGQIYLYGNWTNNYGNSGFDAGNGTVYFVGNTAQIISSVATEGTETFYHVNMNNDFDTSVSGNLIANGNLTVQSGKIIQITDDKYFKIAGNIVNDGQITISNTGSLAQTGLTSSISGTGTFQLNKISLPLDHYYDYVYWSSPINSSTFTLGEIVNNAWRYYKFDPNIVNNPGQIYPGWVQLSNTDIAEKGIGYAITAPNGTTANTTLSAQFIKGNDPFNTGDINVPIFMKGGPNNIGNENLIGNPYPSAIDFNAFANDNTHIAASYSLWTNCAGLDANGHHQDSGYTTYVVSGTAVSACNTGETARQYIATAQGFMVTANTDNSSVTFKNTHRVAGNNDNFVNRPATNDRDVVWIDMTDDTGKFSQIAIGFYDGATDNYDRLFDAKNPNTDSGFTLYSLLNTNKLAIQGLERSNIINKTIALGLENDVNNNITFHINRLTGFDNIDIYLKDNYLNVTHDLKASDYVVNVNNGIIEDRFELIFESVLSNEEITLEANSFLLWQNTDNFIIKSTNHKDIITGLQVFDVTGKLLYENQDLQVIEHQINLRDVAAGNLLLFRFEINHTDIAVKRIIKQ
jgi:hypothetical protein